MAFVTASQVYEATEARETAVYTEGTFGQAVTFVQAVKFFTLLMITALGTWISGYTIGEVLDDLLSWFNKY